MLHFEFKDNILHVTDTQMCFRQNLTNHWYYDIKNWKVSSLGKIGDKPDRDMTPESIEWCKKHYLPKVGINL